MSADPAVSKATRTLFLRAVRSVVLLSEPSPFASRLPLVASPSVVPFVNEPTMWLTLNRFGEDLAPDAFVSYSHSTGASLPAAAAMAVLDRHYGSFLAVYFAWHSKVDKSQGVSPSSVVSRNPHSLFPAFWQGHR